MKKLIYIILFWTTLAQSQQQIYEDLDLKGNTLKNVKIHSFDDKEALDAYAATNNYGVFEKNLLASTINPSHLYLWNGTVWQRADSIFEELERNKTEFTTEGEIIIGEKIIYGLSSQKSLYVAPKNEEEGSHQNFIFCHDGVTAFGISNGLTGLYAHRNRTFDYLTFKSKDYISLQAEKDIRIDKIVATDTMTIKIAGSEIFLKNGKSILQLQKTGVLLEYNGQTIVIDDNGINIGNGHTVIPNPNPPAVNSGAPGTGF